jgi:hypothetical protein
LSERLKSMTHLLETHGQILVCMALDELEAEDEEYIRKEAS